MTSLERALTAAEKLVTNPTPPTTDDYICAYGAIHRATTEFHVGFIVRGIRELCDAAMEADSGSRTVPPRCQNLTSWCARLAAARD